MDSSRYKTPPTKTWRKFPDNNNKLKNTTSTPFSKWNHIDDINIKLKTPNPLSPIDRVRFGINRRAKDLGLNIINRKSFEGNQSFPRIIKRKLPNYDIDLDTSIRLFNTYNYKMDKIRVDGANGLRFSARRAKGFFTPGTGSPFTGSIANSTSESLMRIPKSGINPNKAVFTIDSKTSQILIVNNNACELLNYTPKELCSLQFSNLLTNKNRSHVSALAEGQLNSEDGTMVLLSGKVVEMNTKNGTTVAVSLWIRQIDADGRCLAVAEPVERRVAQLIVDCHGFVISGDYEALMLFQIESIEQFNGMDVTTLIPAILLPDPDNSVITKNIRKQKATGRTQDGIAFPLCLLISQQDSGTDTTDSGMSNQSNNLYLITIWVFTNLSGLLVIDENGIIESCNHHFSMLMFGFAQNKIQGNHITKIIPNFGQEFEFLGYNRSRNATVSSLDNEESETETDPVYVDRLVDVYDTTSLNYNNCDTVSNEGLTSQMITSNENAKICLDFTSNSRLSESTSNIDCNEKSYSNQILTKSISDNILLTENYENNRNIANLNYKEIDINKSLGKSNKSALIVATTTTNVVTTVTTTTTTTTTVLTPNQITSAPIAHSYIQPATGDLINLNKVLNNCDNGGVNGSAINGCNKLTNDDLLTPVNEGLILSDMSNYLLKTSTGQQKSITSLNNSSQSMHYKTADISLALRQQNQQQQTTSDFNLSKVSTTSNIGSAGTPKYNIQNDADYINLITSTPDIRKMSTNLNEPLNTGNMLNSNSILTIKKQYMDGKYKGEAIHYDNNIIDILYTISSQTLPCGRKVFCVWICRDPDTDFDIDDEGKNQNLTLTFNSINSTIDNSLGQAIKLTAAQNSSRPNSVSLVSQCEEEQVCGEFSKHYTTLKQIGKGAYGYVKMAYRNTDRLLVIAKFILKEKLGPQFMVANDEKKEIPKEIYLLTTVKHPNIVTVYDVFENEKFFQLVMEKHGSGMDLFEFIDRRPMMDEKLGCFIFRQIANAVDYLHSLKILHRDIKDENIIIDQNFHVKLIDFGSATFMEDGKLFSTFFGTTEYCSPEVLAGNKYAGPELEMWSLGVTLYVLVFFENPFLDVEETLRHDLTMPHAVSNGLELLLLSMLDKNPKTRCTMRQLMQNQWLTQEINPNSFNFTWIVPCEPHEANPDKYFTGQIYSSTTALSTASPHDSLSLADDDSMIDAQDVCDDEEIDEDGDNGDEDDDDEDKSLPSQNDLCCDKVDYLPSMHMLQQSQYYQNDMNRLNALQQQQQHLNLISSTLTTQTSTTTIAASTAGNQLCLTKSNDGNNVCCCCCPSSSLFLNKKLPSLKNFNSINEYSCCCGSTCSIVNSCSCGGVGGSLVNSLISNSSSNNFNDDFNLINLNITTNNLQDTSDIIEQTIQQPSTSYKLMSKTTNKYNNGKQQQQSNVKLIKNTTNKKKNNKTDVYIDFTNADNKIMIFNNNKTLHKTDLIKTEDLLLISNDDNNDDSDSLSITPEEELKFLTLKRKKKICVDKEKECDKGEATYKCNDNNDKDLDMDILGETLSDINIAKELQLTTSVSSSNSLSNLDNILSIEITDDSCYYENDIIEDYDVNDDEDDDDDDDDIRFMIRDNNSSTDTLFPVKSIIRDDLIITTTSSITTPSTSTINNKYLEQTTSNSSLLIDNCYTNNSGNNLLTNLTSSKSENNIFDKKLNKNKKYLNNNNNSNMNCCNNLKNNLNNITTKLNNYTIYDVVSLNDLNNIETTENFPNYTMNDLSKTQILNRITSDEEILFK